MAVLSADGISFEIDVPIAIVGGGACGMAAALAAQDAGSDPVILERDPVPWGSTALSSGMVPACGTGLQREQGIDDSVEIMAADIQAKAHGMADPAMVKAVCQASGPMIEWLTDVHGVEMTLVEGFLYPGHSRLRMHAPPSRAGADLIGGLTLAAERAGVAVMTDARVADLYADAEGRVRGLRIERPDGAGEMIGCGALVLACNGFGGNPAMVRSYIPEMAEANYFGHEGNQGSAVVWGQALGAATRDLGSYQGHGSVAHPHRILISWALMMEGGIQVNAEGRRFSNEHDGYSEQARRVLAQPGGIAWDVFDDRLDKLGQDFDDYRKAQAMGAVRTADSVELLADIIGAPVAALRETLAEVGRLAVGEGVDAHGRDFTSKHPLMPPYHAVKVTGSLFHTQGGLVVDHEARVLREDRSPLPNLLAGGGAACGVSGPEDWGYLSGNGLLTALTLGRLAGITAARTASAIP
jgi:fumarate reductase flavoprotein subunit